MNILLAGVLLSFCLQLFCSSYAVPISVQSNEVSSSLEEEDDTSIIEQDDITTRGLERLSSAATCLVAGVEYTHGQQIYRRDPCEFCLCLDGEMFCWWQDCPPTMEGPCRDRGPFSPCVSIPVAPQKRPTVEKKTKDISNIISSSLMPTTKTLTTIKSYIIPDIQTSVTNSASSESNFQVITDVASTEQHTEETTAPENEKSSSDNKSLSTTSDQPKICYVMGLQYQIGDKLPHDTGNCLECICGEGARVTCSPHQCAPIADEMNDYRPPEGF